MVTTNYIVRLNYSTQKPEDKKTQMDGIVALLQTPNETLLERVTIIDISDKMLLVSYPGTLNELTDALSGFPNVRVFEEGYIDLEDPRKKLR